MELAKSIPHYTLSPYQEGLMEKIAKIIESKTAGVSYVGTAPRQHGTTDALTMLLAILLVTEPNLRVTVMSPYRSNSERMLTLTSDWLVKMQKTDGVTKSRHRLRKDTSGLCYMCIHDAAPSWNPSVIIITEAEYVNPNAIGDFLCCLTVDTNIIVMNYNIENVKHVGAIWARANEDKKEQVD